MPANDYSWLILRRPLTTPEIGRGCGGAQPDFEAMIAQMVDGDEVWEFETSDSIQYPFSGQSGLALKRGSQIIAHLVTRRLLY